MGIKKIIQDDVSDIVGKNRRRCLFCVLIFVIGGAGVGIALGVGGSTSTNVFPPSPPPTNNQILSPPPPPPGQLSSLPPPSDGLINFFPPSPPPSSSVNVNASFQEIDIDVYRERLSNITFINSGNISISSESVTIRRVLQYFNLIFNQYVETIIYTRDDEESELVIYRLSQNVNRTYFVEFPLIRNSSVDIQTRDRNGAILNNLQGILWKPPSPPAPPSPPCDVTLISEERDNVTVLSLSHIYIEPVSWSLSIYISGVTSNSSNISGYFVVPNTTSSIAITHENSNISIALNAVDNLPNRFVLGNFPLQNLSYNNYENITNPSIVIDNTSVTPCFAQS